MNRKTFQLAVQRALDELPDEYKNLLDNIQIEVMDEPPSEIRRKLDYKGKLLGLYHGIPRIHRGVWYSSLPDKILLFRGAIQRICRNRDEVVDQIKATLIHEIGHYFGLEEDEMPY
ncbi:MAG: metallopeptidase family protein [Candidatus Eremiobacteraeota bacterium]|nr:metallopeptidase family protein [Candidatus Eremiobacteraeota bacterium]